MDNVAKNEMKRFDERRGFETMRRSELWRYCKAYGVDVDEKMRHDKLVMRMNDLQNSGMFNGHAIYPEYLRGWPANPPAKVLPVSTEPIAEIGTPVDCSSEWMGTKRKWCVMRGNTILHEGLKSEEDANGLHIPASS